MKKLPTCIYVWTGETMQPTLHFARLAESSFTSGQAYRLIVAEETEKKIKRSKQQNDKMWAMLTEISDQAEHCGRRAGGQEVAGPDSIEEALERSGEGQRGSDADRQPDGY